MRMCKGYATKTQPRLTLLFLMGRSDRLRQGYGGPPKLHAKAEDRPYRQLAGTSGDVGDVGANLTVQAVNLAPQAFGRSGIVRGERRVLLLFQLAHLGLDRRLVDADHDVMLVRVDAERFAERRQQMLFVHLRIAL